MLRADRSDQEFLSIYAPNDRLLAGDPDLLPDPAVTGRNPRLGNGEFRGLEVRKATYRIETAAGQVTLHVRYSGTLLLVQ